MKTLTSGTVLTNVSIFVHTDIIFQMLDSGMYNNELMDNLIEKSAQYIVAKKATVRTSSSNPTLFADFSYNVGRNAYNLTARYDDEQKEWRLAH